MEEESVPLEIQVLNKVFRVDNTMMTKSTLILQIKKALVNFQFGIRDEPASFSVKIQQSLEVKMDFQVVMLALYARTLLQQYAADKEDQRPLDKPPKSKDIVFKISAPETRITIDLHPAAESSSRFLRCLQAADFEAEVLQETQLLTDLGCKSFEVYVKDISVSKNTIKFKELSLYFAKDPLIVMNEFRFDIESEIIDQSEIQNQAPADILNASASSSDEDGGFHIYQDDEQDSSDQELEGSSAGKQENEEVNHSSIVHHH